MLRQFLYLLLFFSTSCAIYSPHVAPPVLVEDAGDTQIDIGLTGPVALGLQTNFAVAATDNLSLQLAARFYAKENFMLDGSIGRSKNIGKRSRLGLFAGASGGSGKNKYSILYDDFEINGTSRLYYLRPQWTIHTKKVDFVLSSKFGKINQDFYYYRKETGADGDWVEYVIDEDRELSALFIEPSISIIFKNKTGRLALTSSYIINNGTNQQQGGISPFNTGLSFQYFKKRQK
ncbi:MAG: hypothetical protein ABJF04_20835 [Reichenbachiella sp.]|uniref:hypothetical protein n=1 Tax=Reichenbachiella sp. TaxID=2184521 RepID=UPI0032679E65